MGLFRLHEDENYDKLCGQILFTTKGRLAFYCTLCGHYWSYETFIAHLLEKCSRLVDDDLRECISQASLTGTTSKCLVRIPEKCSNIQDPVVVNKTEVLHNGNSAPETQSDAKTYVQAVEIFIPNQEGSTNCKSLSKLSDPNQMQLQRNTLFEPTNATDTIQFELDENKIIDETIDQDLIEVDYCDENINEYENFEYLEDEPIEKEIENSYLFKKNESDELKDSLQSSSENNVDKQETETREDNGKPNEKHFQNKPGKPFLDSVSVPLVVRNVQARKKYFPSHINPEERKFVCPVCGAAFKDRTNRNYHLRRHTNNKRHSCPDCGKKFYTSTEVKIHSRVHSRPEKQFLCTECGRSFESNFKLLNHQKRHTNQRDYVCKVCSKGFYQSEGLKAHMAVHSSARPYSCEVCGAAFKRPHILKSHMKQHENKREYKCKLCEAAFNVQAGLHSHMKTKHKEFVQVD